VGSTHHPGHGATSFEPLCALMTIETSADAGALITSSTTNPTVIIALFILRPPK
jgi:hypothetical protein